MIKEDYNLPSNKILSIIKEGYKDDKELLFLFSSYIASNPDFKYNTTYLTDSIDQFFIDYNMYSRKILIFEEIINYLNKLNSSKHEIEIEFDSKYRYSTNINLNLEIVKKNNTNVDPFDFHNIGSKQFLFKIIQVKPKRIEYTYLIDTEDKSKHWKKKVSNFISIVEKQNNEEK